MNKLVKGVLRYTLSAAFGLGVAWLTATYRGFSAALPSALNARYISDGLFVGGMILTCVGAIALISTTDFFDIFAYGFKSLIVLFTALVKPSQHKTFYEYKLEREEKRNKPSGFLLIVGVALLVAAFVFLQIYENSVYGG